nr:J492 [uncultured bacterium]
MIDLMPFPHARKGSLDWHHRARSPPEDAPGALVAPFDEF